MIDFKSVNFFLPVLKSLDNRRALFVASHNSNTSHFYASPSSWEAYRYRQLTTNFELKFFVCWHISIWVFQNSVCPYPDKRKSPWLRYYHSYISNWSMERSSRVQLQYGNFLFQKSSNWRNWILSVPRQKKSSWFRRYQSYISNWYINLTSTTPWKPEN